MTRATQNSCARTSYRDTGCTDTALDEIRTARVARPEIQQCYDVAGEWDCVLFPLVKNIPGTPSRPREMFLGNDNIRRFSTHLVMEAPKVSLAVPLG